MEGELMTLTPEDLDRLEALAGEATPGPWCVGLGVSWSGVETPCVESSCVEIASECADEDARYLAALDPDTVRELVRGYREADDLLTELRDALSVIAEEYNHCHGCDRHYDYDLKRIIHLPVCLLYEPEP